MIKLTEQSNLNSPESYDAIFKERQKKGVDEHDMRRWKRLLKHYKGGKLIDLGCLDSLVTVFAREKYPFAHIKGIDVSHTAIDEMGVKYPSIEFEEKSLFDFNYGGCYDYAILGEVIEHLPNPNTAIAEAMRILKPGGVLAISTPLEEAREPGAIDGDRHLWSFSKLDMESMLMEYGKVELDVVGSLFSWKPPFYRYCWPSLIAFCTKQ